MLELSVVTPTRGRPTEVNELIANLAAQQRPPGELILVDGADASDTATESVAAVAAAPFPVRHIRHGGGTAIQRNVGIDAAAGRFIALVDDDIRLEPTFFEVALDAFTRDPDGSLGGVTGYISNQHLDPATSPRWRWYKRLRLFSTYEPGRYDWATGYPINRYLQPPHDGERPIDFMGAGCAVWRREVFDTGLRFSRFFSGYGILEDAHFALRAGRRWRLLELGRARCVHLHAPGGRVDTREIARKSATNYRYVFIDLVPRRSFSQETRFWLVQGVDLLRMTAHAVRRPSSASWLSVVGKLEGLAAAARLAAPGGT